MPLARWSLFSRIAASVVGLGLAVVAASPAYSEAPGGQAAVAADSGGQSGLHLPFAGHIGGIVKDDQPIVDVTVDKFGGGIFAVAPGGLFCNEQCSTLAASVPKGTPVSVTAQPSAGWEIRGWTGCTPSADKTNCTANAAEGGHIHVSFGQIGTAFTAPLHFLTSASTSGMHISGTTYTFPSNSELDSVLAGDFIATFEGDGFLRKVLTINRHDNVVDMTTADASILDVIANGTLTLGLAPLPGVTPPPGGQGFDINLPINANFGGGSSATGNLAAHGALYAEINVANGAIQSLHIGVTVSADGNVQASVNTLSSPVIPVGDVKGGCFPGLVVPVCVDISLTAQAIVTSSGPTSLGGTFSLDASGDVYFDASGIRTSGGVTKDWTITPPNTLPDASIKLNLQPSVDVSVLGNVAASIDIPVQMDAEMSTSHVPFVRAFATVQGNALIHKNPLFLPNGDLGPFQLFNESEEFYRSPTIALQLYKAGGGSVTGTDSLHAANVDCPVGTTRCDVAYNPPIGTTVDHVTLTATPAPGWQFLSWSFGCNPPGSTTCVVTMDQAKQITVIFVPVP